VPIVVAVVIAMVATFARLFQLMALLLCLAAVFAMFADGFIQLLFSLANLFLASVVAVARAGWNCPGSETEYHKCGD
jgi:hypothetical protein